MKMTVKIDKNTGKASVSVDGAKGASCLNLTKLIRSQAEADAPLKRTKDFDHEIAVVGSASVNG